MSMTYYTCAITSRKLISPFKVWAAEAADITSLLAQGTWEGRHMTDLTSDQRRSIIRCSMPVKE